MLQKTLAKVSMAYHFVGHLTKFDLLGFLKPSEFNWKNTEVWILAEFCVTFIVYLLFHTANDYRFVISEISCSS